MPLSEIQQAVLRWRDGGPALFAQEVLKAEPTEQQWEASRAIVKTRRVSIRSGHGTGKSTFMAWCVLWFLACYFPCKVPATAPTSHQLQDVLWSEIAKWHRVMADQKPALAAQFDWSNEAFRMKAAPNESFSVARTSRPERPEALQGFHSDNILFLIDEASGVADNVFEVAEGALSTDGAFVVMAANPDPAERLLLRQPPQDARLPGRRLHWDGEQRPAGLAPVHRQHGQEVTVASPAYSRYA